MKNIRLTIVSFIWIITLLCFITVLPACTPKPPSSTTILPTNTGNPSVTIEITAENMAFDKNTISVPAGADVLVVFTNKDRVPHNVAFYETQAAVKTIFIGEVFSGPKAVSYRFLAPSIPGNYFFRCDVHPATMIGDFIVTAKGS